MSDERDDDDDTKSSKRSKKRFQERDDSDEGDDDRPRKKNRRDDDDAEDDDRPRSRRKTDDADDDRPKKKRVDDEDEDDRPKKTRRVVDDGPRVKSNDNIPILMLLAFIGSAVGLLAVCAGCGWFSFDWLVGGGSGGGGGGGGGNEMEVTSVSRTPGFRAFEAPSVSWSVKSLQNPSGGGQYYVVMKCGSQTATEQIYPSGKAWTMTSGRPRNELSGANGQLEVWVEKRSNPVATGKVVSNVYKVP